MTASYLGHGEERLGAARDVDRLEVAESVGEDGQLDLGPLQAAQLVLVVEPPDVHLGEKFKCCD